MKPTEAKCRKLPNGDVMWEGDGLVAVRETAAQRAATRACLQQRIAQIQAELAEMDRQDGGTGRGTGELKGGGQ